MPKLHKALPAFRGITACCGTTTEGIVAKVVNDILVGIRPVLNALWREECIRIGISIAKECWITSGGIDIVDILNEMDNKAKTLGVETLPHRFETFDFVAMYNNIHVACLKRVVKELLELWFMSTRNPNSGGSRCCTLGTLAQRMTRNL